MNTIAIVEEWDQFQDDNSIDWTGFPDQQAVAIPDRRAGLREEYAQHYELPSRAEGRRFGYVASDMDFGDDDPE